MTDVLLHCTVLGDYFFSSSFVFLFSFSVLVVLCFGGGCGGGGGGGGVGMTVGRRYIYIKFITADESEFLYRELQMCTGFMTLFFSFCLRRPLAVILSMAEIQLVLFRTLISSMTRLRLSWTV